MQVANNRGACCHVAGDIDFDKHNNLWLVTGDDTPSGGGNSGGFAPFNDQKTNESQTVRDNNATGGTFTLTFDGQTTAPIAYNATNAVTQAALEALSNIDPGDVGRHRERGQHRQPDGRVPRAARGEERRADDGQRRGPDGHDADRARPVARRAACSTRRTSMPAGRARNTNDLRGKVLRINVSADGALHEPADNLFPEAADAGDKTRPEIYAMGFRNPFRIQVDENDVAYVTDYSPDSRDAAEFRGPAGIGRVEIVRQPANYGWPMCRDRPCPTTGGTSTPPRR